MGTVIMVTIPKTMRTFSKFDKKHLVFKVSVAKRGKESKRVQGKRRYDRKQAGYGGQTKPVFRKKAKTTKKLILKLEADKRKVFRVLPRAKTVVIEDKKKGGGKKGKNPFFM